MRFTIEHYDEEIGKIELIKMFRELTGSDLMTVKDIVESGKPGQIDSTKWPPGELMNYFEKRGIGITVNKDNSDLVNFILTKLSKESQQLAQDMDAISLFADSYRPIVNLQVDSYDKSLSKINIIKVIREATGVGLKEAKDAVDNISKLLVNKDIFSIEKLKELSKAEGIKLDYTQSADTIYLVMTSLAETKKTAEFTNKVIEPADDDHKYQDYAQKKDPYVRKPAREKHIKSDSSFFMGRAKKEVTKSMAKLKAHGRFYVFLLLVLSGILTYYGMTFFPMVIVAAAFIGWRFRKIIPNGYIPAVKYAIKLVVVFYILNAIVVHTVANYLYGGYIFADYYFHALSGILFSGRGLMFLIISVVLVAIMVYRKKNTDSFVNQATNDKSRSRKTDESKFSLKFLDGNNKREKAKDRSNIVSPDAYKKERQRRQARQRKLDKNEKSSGSNRFANSDKKIKF